MTQFCVSHWNAIYALTTAYARKTVEVRQTRLKNESAASEISSARKVLRVYNIFIASARAFLKWVQRWVFYCARVWKKKDFLWHCTCCEWIVETPVCWHGLLAANFNREKSKLSCKHAAHARTQMTRELVFCCCCHLGGVGGVARRLKSARTQIRCNLWTFRPRAGSLHNVYTRHSQPPCLKMSNHSFKDWRTQTAMFGICKFNMCSCNYHGVTRIIHHFCLMLRSGLHLYFKNFWNHYKN